MGLPNAPTPVLPILAAFTRHNEALDWTRDRAVETFGPIAQESPAFDFDQTDYYEASMGPDLKKTFFTFAQLIDPGQIVDIKLQTNAWEEEYAASAGHAETRPLNLDPGYITLGKLVLASTKDFAHRIYLDRGIHAEVTLFYQRGAWQSHQWTFADYRSSEYHRFFTQCRDYLHRRYREGNAT